MSPVMNLDALAGISWIQTAFWRREDFFEKGTPRCVEWRGVGVCEKTIPYNYLMQNYCGWRVGAILKSGYFAVKGRVGRKFVKFYGIVLSRRYSVG